MAKDAPTAETNPPPADKADETTDGLAVQPDNPESNEEEFSTAFEEFAAHDDTDPVTEPLPAGDKASATTDKTASGDEPSDADAPADERAAPDGAATPETPDIWANATTEQKAAFEAADHENQSNRPRLSAQNRKIADLMAKQTPAAAPAAAAPVKPTAEAIAKAAEDWEEFKTEYPDVATAFEQQFGGRITGLEAENATLRNQVAGITDAQAQVTINTEEALLTERHPDWAKLTASDDFIAWLPQQPRYVQEGLVRNGTAIIDGAEAASLIDIFVKDRQPPAPKTPEADPTPPKDNDNGKTTRRERRLESAVTTERGQAGPGAGPPEGDFDAAFDHFAKQP